MHKPPSVCAFRWLLSLRAHLDHDPDPKRFIFFIVLSTFFFLSPAACINTKTTKVSTLCVNRLVIVVDFSLCKQKIAFEVEVFSAVNYFLQCVITLA